VNQTNKLAHIQPWQGKQLPLGFALDAQASSPWRDVSTEERARARFVRVSQGQESDACFGLLRLRACILLDNRPRCRQTGSHTARTAEADDVRLGCGSLRKWPFTSPPIICVTPRIRRLAQGVQVQAIVHR